MAVIAMALFRQATHIESRLSSLEQRIQLITSVNFQHYFVLSSFLEPMVLVYRPQTALKGKCLAARLYKVIKCKQEERKNAHVVMHLARVSFSVNEVFCAFLTCLSPVEVKLCSAVLMSIWTTFQRCKSPIARQQYISNEQMINCCGYSIEMPVAARVISSGGTGGHLPPTFRSGGNQCKMPPIFRLGTFLIGVKMPKVNQFFKIKWFR